MTLLDAYALVAFLVGGPATAQVRGLLREGDAMVATANLAEALDVSQRVYGLPITRAVEILDTLFEGSLGTMPLDIIIARKAAEIRAAHYHRSTRPISLADAILLASADHRMAGSPRRTPTSWLSRERKGSRSSPSPGRAESRPSPRTGSGYRRARLPSQRALCPLSTDSVAGTPPGRAPSR